MRYGKDHKENTHRHVVQVAAERFRKDGLDGVGVATLMGDAGLTHGGFYSHFASKEALIEEVIECGMDDSFSRIIEASKGGGVEAFVRHYLRPAHRAHPEKGCLAAALGPEIGRRSKETREAFTRKLRQMVSHLESLLPDHTIPRRRRPSSPRWSARCSWREPVADGGVSDQLLKAGEAAAIALARKK